MRVLALGLVAFILLFNNCGPSLQFDNQFQSSLNLYGLGTGSPLEQQVLGIFAAKCSNCHNSQMDNGGVRDIMDIQQLIVRGYIYPGSLDYSRLWAAIANNSMPRGGPPLSGEEKALIKAWILGSQ